MNTSILKKASMGLLLFVALGLSACAKKEGSATRVAGRSNGAAPIPNTPNTCSQGQSNVGKIYGTSYNFENDVKGFVSATLSPDQLGQIGYDINSPTGIDLYGSFQFDSNGQIVAQNTNVKIRIFDSYAVAYNGQPAMVQPYQISAEQAYSGSIQRSGSMSSFNVTFKDEYGEFTFSGNVNQSGIANGTVTYRNYVAVSGYSPASGTLGQFTMYACALIK
ncbi:hypothetical protein BDW_08200 [Bdellovibrio bacteriovorus W]|nr:hypothetical protein BDW_08200 [Bdellovibrio bacteriovorus W]